MSPCISSYLRLPTKKFKFVNNDLKRTINTPKNISQNILGNEYRYQPYILSWLMTHGYVLHAFVMMTFVSFVITWVSISIMRPLHVSPSSPHSQLRPISMYSQETAKQSNEKRLHSLDFFIAGVSQFFFVVRQKYCKKSNSFDRLMFYFDYSFSFLNVVPQLYCIHLEIIMRQLCHRRNIVLVHFLILNLHLN